MNAIFEVNYAAFSIFASLLITEIMGAVVMLLIWPARERVLDYPVPIWEVTGTFGAFWVVTGDFAFPGLLLPVASIFTPLLFVFLILWVARGSAMAFAEFIARRGWLDETKLYRAYAVATVALGVVVLVLLSSLVGGQGIDLSSGTFSISAWTTAGSVAFVIGTMLLIVGLSPVFFDLRALRNLVLPFALAGVALSTSSYFLMDSGLLTWWMAVPMVLTLVACLLYVIPVARGIMTNKAVFLALVSVVIFSLQPLVYPNAIGQAIAIDSVTTTGAMAGAFLSVTAVGGLLLTAMLLLYAKVAARGPSGPDLPSA